MSLPARGATSRAPQRAPPSAPMAGRAQPRRFLESVQRLSGARHGTEPHPQQGLTLVEAAVVVAIVAISVTAAVPSLQRLLEQRRLDAAASELAATLQLARNESIAQPRGALRP